MKINLNSCEAKNPVVELVTSTKIQKSQQRLVIIAVITPVYT